MKKCPYCLRDLQDTAIKCKFCRRVITGVKASISDSDVPWGIKDIVAIIVLTFTITYLVSIAFSYFYYTIAQYNAMEVTDKVTAFLPSLLLPIISTVLIYINITRFYNRNFLKSLRLVLPKKSILCLTPLIALCIYFVGKLFPTPSVATNFQKVFATHFSRKVFVFAAILIAPVCEEILWRGFIYPVISRKLKLTMSILVTSLLFTLGHAWMFWGASYLLIKLFIKGVALTTARALSGSTFTSILIHLFNNIFAFIG